jgi:hypothetical protein
MVVKEGSQPFVKFSKNYIKQQMIPFMILIKHAMFGRKDCKFNELKKQHLFIAEGLGESQKRPADSSRAVMVNGTF